jgi:hypothetical protein
MSTQSTSYLPHEFNLPKGAPPELISAIEDAVRGVLTRHGMSAFEMSREAAIAHEAGHVIVGAHEGFTVQSARIFFRSMPPFGTVWGGWYEESGKEWTSDLHTSIESDLSRARVIIGGLAGETACHLDKPASSLDEVALSQVVGLNAAKKLIGPKPSYVEDEAYIKRLWNERVWKVALTILWKNCDPFNQLVRHLHERERVKGSKLRAVLAQVRRIAP